MLSFRFYELKFRNLFSSGSFHFNNTDSLYEEIFLPVAQHSWNKTLLVAVFMETKKKKKEVVAWNSQKRV